MTDHLSVLDRAMANPAKALDELNRLRCERSLSHFVRTMWPDLEPSTPLVEGWPLEAICLHLEAVERGEIKRLLINVPPGFMKSMLCSVFFPAWLWGPRGKGHLRFISTSYAQDLAIRDNVRCRDLMGKETFQRWWGHQWEFSGDQNAKVRYENTKMGFRQAASTGSALTGHRGDILVVDDPHSVGSAESDQERKDALFWFGETLPTRFNNQKEGVMIVIMQRLHQEDVSGFILGSAPGRKALKGWTHLMIPMEYEAERKCSTPLPWADPRTTEGELAWPDRFAREEVEDLKDTFRAAGGEYAVSGQLQQNPIPREGGMFQQKDFQIIDRMPEGYFRICRGWDLAATKDGHGARTAGIKMAYDGRRVIIIDSDAGRWGPHEVEEAILACAKRDGPSVTQSLPQDPGQAGKAQKSYLGAKLAGHDFYFSPESGAKEDRARPLSAQSEAGNLYVLRGPWNDALIKEFCSFPAGTLKDQVDGGSRAFAWLLMNRPSEVGAAPEVL